MGIKKSLIVLIFGISLFSCSSEFESVPETECPCYIEYSRSNILVYASRFDGDSISKIEHDLIDSILIIYPKIEYFEVPCNNK